METRTNELGVDICTHASVDEDDRCVDCGTLHVGGLARCSRCRTPGAFADLEQNSGVCERCLFDANA